MVFVLDTTIEREWSANAQNENFSAFRSLFSIEHFSRFRRKLQGVAFQWFDFGPCLRRWWSPCIHIFSVHISSTSVTWIASSVSVPQTARPNLTLSSFFFCKYFFRNKYSNCWKWKAWCFNLAASRLNNKNPTRYHIYSRCFAFLYLHDVVYTLKIDGILSPNMHTHAAFHSLTIN